MNARFTLLLALTVFMAGAPGTGRTENPATAPQWIWARVPNSEESHIKVPIWHFERRFTAQRAAGRALLRIAADDCRAELRLNRHTVLRLEPFSPTADVDVSRFLVAGENHMEIVAQTTGAAPALATRLVLEMPHGESAPLISDGDWSARLIAEGGASASFKSSSRDALGERIQ